MRKNLSSIPYSLLSCKRNNSEFMRKLTSEVSREKLKKNLSGLTEIQVLYCGRDKRTDRLSFLPALSFFPLGPPRDSARNTTVKKLFYGLGQTSNMNLVTLFYKKKPRTNRDGRFEEANKTPRKMTAAWVWTSRRGWGEKQEIKRETIPHLAENSREELPNTSSFTCSLHHSEANFLWVCAQYE